MQIQEQTTETIEATPAFAADRASIKIKLNFPNPVAPEIAVKANSTVPSQAMFECVARTTLAERFPLLTCFAVSLGLLACALITEVECLKGSGYFWR